MRQDTARRRPFPRLSRSHLMVLVAGAALWWGVAVVQAARKSAVADEPPHFGAGMAMLALGDFRMNPEHPPLVKVLAALPAFLFGEAQVSPSVEAADGYRQTLVIWLESLQGEWGYYLLYAAEGDHRRSLFFARLVMLAIGFAGGVIVWLWGRELGGSPWAGTIAAGLLLYYPEFLGHSQYVTLDVPLAVACGAVAWTAWQWWRRPTRGLGAVFVLACALASLVKLPASFFVLFLLVSMALLAGLARDGARMRGVAMLTLVIFAACWLGAWAGAGFRFAAIPEGAEITARSAYLPNGDETGLVGSVVAMLWRARLLPEATLATLKHVGSFTGRLMFLNGEYSREGWLHYFLVTFLLKTPLPMVLGTVVLASVALWKARRVRRSRLVRARGQRMLFLLLPYLGLFGMTVLSRANLGHRYILFLYLPLCAALGALAWRGLRSRKRSSWGVTTALLLLQATACAVGVRYSAVYFNVLAGGTPYRGARFLWDSNVDWGQDVHRLMEQAEDLRGLGYPAPNVAVFGYNDLATYGLTEYRWIVPNYPFAIVPVPPSPPDPAAPTLLSLMTLPAAQQLYPGLYAREPDAAFGSIVLYLPEGTPAR